MGHATFDVREGYANWARKYDLDDNPLIRLEERAVAGLRLDVPRIALDAACGTGRHATRLALCGSVVVGIDVSSEMLAVARAKSFQFGGLPIQYVQGPIHEELPIALESVDLAVCGLALCHLMDLRSAVLRLCETVRRGGLGLVTDLRPAAIKAGLVTLFSVSGVQYAIETVQHATEDYISALESAGAEVQSLRELSLGEAFEREPRGLPETVYEVGW